MQFDFSEKEKIYLLHIAKSGHVFCTFGTQGSEWSFPVSYKSYVGYVPIEDNMIFERFKRDGLIQHRVLPFPSLAWECSLTPLAFSLIKLQETEKGGENE